MIIPACSPDPEHAPGVRLTHATLAAVAAPGTRLPNRAHWLVDSGPRLTGSAKETLALVANGIHFAQQITRIDRTLFAEQHKEIFSVERANDIYNRAQRTHALALALFADHAAGLDRTGLHALPKVNSQKQADLAADSVPDWQTLFGTFDFCACEECASVHGPAVFKPQDEDFRLRPDGRDNGACGGALPRRTTPLRTSCLKINTIYLLARCTDAGSYDVVMTPPAGSITMTLDPDEEYGGLHAREENVAALGIEVVPTDPPATWPLQMTRPGGGNLTEGPVQGIMEVEDVMLVLGYEWN